MIAPDRTVALVLQLAQESGALALHTLLLELEALASGHEFVVAEVFAHARRPEHARLRRAIVAAVGELNAIRLGQYLARWRDVDAAGLTLAALGKEGGATVWAVHSKPAPQVAPDTGIVVALSPLCRTAT